MVLAAGSDAKSATGTGSKSFSFTPTLAPQGAGIILIQEGAGDNATNVAYGALALTRRIFRDKSTGEAGAVYIYYDGSNIPSGAQTISWDLANDNIGVVFTVTADGNTTFDVVTSDVSDSLDDPSLAITFTATLTTWLGYYGIFTGLITPETTVETGCVHMRDGDLGPDGGMTCRKSGALTSSTTMGYTTSSADDVVHAAIIIKDATAGTDGTATPAVIATTSTIPQPGVSASAGPSVIATSSAVPQAGVGAGAGPAAIVTSSTVPRPGVSAGAAPSAIATSSTIPAPSFGAARWAVLPSAIKLRSGGSWL